MFVCLFVFVSLFVFVCLFVCLFVLHLCASFGCQKSCLLTPDSAVMTQLTAEITKREGTLSQALDEFELRFKFQIVGFHQGFDVLV